MTSVDTPAPSPADRAASGPDLRGAIARPFGLFERTVAARYLRSKRAHGGVTLISIISFLGIMLAVAVLIIVMSVMNGFRHDLLDRLLGAQGHVFVYGMLTDQASTDDLAARLEREPGVLRAAPVISGQAGIMNADAFSGVLVYGLAREDLESLDIVRDGIRFGDLENFGVGERGGDSIVIGSQLAQRLGVTAGDPVTIISPSTASTIMGSSFRRKTYYVDAVFSVGMSQIDDLFVYMPIEQARIFFSRDDVAADLIEVSIASPDRVEAARAQLQPLMTGGRYLRDWRDNYSTYVSALNVERNVMRLILMLIVVIAALNIISGLVMLAKNKGRDIAILRTMGATRGAIMRIFVMAGASVGALGTIAGVLLGILFCLNIGAIQAAIEGLSGWELFPADIYFLSSIPALVEWREVASTAAVGFIVSCVATLPPAWNAARLDPVEALRYE